MRNTCLCVLWLASNAFAAEPIDFVRDIRPILSDKCFRCHGPDAAERQAGLRLDDVLSATRPAESGAVPITPAKPDESELVRRIESKDDGERMPPADSPKQLSDAERRLLRQWIAEGGRYEKHWSFVAPTRPALPAVKDAGWARNEIDRFVLARWEREGLSPSPEADRRTLIRRLSLDLLGLPPTPAEVEAFANDPAPDACERLVDRLLASPRHGERMALDWLDAARFADTHGYHIDSGRDMTKWREWVIDAFNRDMPFDQFTIEQVAGDLLPNASLSQLVASGFHRNHMINYEGGAIPDEYHNAYVVDRVNTTGTVWLGLSVACGQCHDHKYDPITQKEYYQLYAFFHNVPENGLDGRAGNAEPMIRVPTPEQEAKRQSLAEQIAQTQEELNRPSPEVDARQAEWENLASRKPKIAWRAVRPERADSKGGARLSRLDDQSVFVRGPIPANDVYLVELALEGKRSTAIRLEVLPDDRLPEKGPGRGSNGNFVLTNVRVQIAGQAPANPRPVRIKEASASFEQKDFPIAAAIDGDPKTGWAIYPQVGRENAAVLEFDPPLETKPGERLQVELEFASGFAQHQIGRFRLSWTDAKDPHGKGTPKAGILAILTTDPGKRTDAQKAELRAYYRATFSPEHQALGARLAKLRSDLTELERRIPTAMVMKDMPSPRDTFVLVRGQYDKPGQKVAPDVPAFLPPLPKYAPRDRLGLARWLVHPSNPLTARVTVNRLWQAFFGVGLVETAEDFGSQGALPSHPDLLDWLAVEFMEPAFARADEAWRIKPLVRKIVTSAAYRQSSAAAPEAYAKDPANRLLSRHPRLRLSAEAIRDQALFVAGLLDHRIGGSSVSPYQPAGLWEELAFREDNDQFTAQSYRQSKGRDLYRRTMYTFWKRTSPPPSLLTFDAPDRETCTVRRARTNTPLQSLVLLNDPTYVEAARKFAERILREGGESTQQRIAFAVHALLARPAKREEFVELERLLQAQLLAFRRDGEAARKLLSVGESPRDPSLDEGQLAAWTLVASVLFNLDETITKG